MDEDNQRLKWANKKIEELKGALHLLLAEVEASGNADAKDYGWPKAVRAAREALRVQQ